MRSGADLLVWSFAPPLALLLLSGNCCFEDKLWKVRAAHVPWGRGYIDRVFLNSCCSEGRAECGQPFLEVSRTHHSPENYSSCKTMENISQATLLQQRSRCNRITEDLAERLLHLVVQLMCLQTGEHYVILKKYGDPNHCNYPRSTYRMSRIQNAIMELPPPSLIPEKNKILEAANEIIELLTGEVPVRCQDFTVFFSMEEWEYVEGHKDLFKDAMMENQQLFASIGCFKSHSGRSSETVKPGNRRAEAMLNITKELIDVLTGESFILVKTSRKVTEKQTSGYLSECQDPIMEPLPHHTVHKRNDKKILETTNQILKLLLGEVPIRCQDIAVNFSKEEWEYLDGQKDLYKHVIMENQQPLVSLDENLPANKPDGHPFISCHLEDRNKNNIGINSTQSRIVISQGDEESIDNMKKNIPSAHETVPGIPVKTESLYSIGKKKKFPCSECGRAFTTKYTLAIHQRLHTGIGIYSCTECDKFYTMKHQLEVHQITHTGVKPFSCHQCHKRFTTMRALILHKTIHTLEDSCSCPKCGQSFKSKTSLHSHLFLNHTCTACGQDFETKYDLEDHMKGHPELKSQHSCTECGKYFLNKGNLKVHYRVHTGEKPFPCLECGKTFAYKSHLISHLRFHTGEGLTCRYCDKFFVDRIRLVEHERIHTGEKPFACSECGRQFSRNTHLLLHQRTHTDIRPFECTACGVHFKCEKAAKRHCKQQRSKKRKALNGLN